MIDNRQTRPFAGGALKAAVGLAASVAVHAAVLLWAVSSRGTANPFEAPPQETVTVDLVSPQEAPPETKRDPQTPSEPVRQPDDRPTDPPAAGVSPQPEGFKPERSAPPRDARLAEREPPSSAPEPPAPPAESDPVETEEKPDASTWFSDMLTTPSTLPSAGFDGASTADSAAKLSLATIADFKAHLSKCWKTPSGTAATANVRIVIRVALKRNGELARDPALLQAPASAAGPPLVQSALSALKQCQPYRLPADKYNEWRMLDLSFTPKGLSGA